MSRLLLIVLCFFFPCVAVLLNGNGVKKALIALVLQLFGHVPGVIYGIWVVTKE